MIDLLFDTAIIMDNVDWMMALLAEKPERLHQIDECGQTVLYVAVQTKSRSLECIRALLSAGADVNSRNRAGFTALHAVIWDEPFPSRSANPLEIIGLLLDAGAEIEDDQNSYAWTPLATAVFHNCHLEARLLLARGANPNKLIPERTTLTGCGGSTLLSLCWLDPEMMRILLEGGADPNLRNRSGQTALEEIQGRTAGDWEAKKEQCLELLRQASNPG